MDNLLIGKWEIQEVANMDMDDIEALGKTFFNIESDQSGEFRFALLEGNIDYRAGEKSGRTILEFSWEGFQNEHHSSGRGFLTNQDKLMIGKLLIHKGEELSFICFKVE